MQKQWADASRGLTEAGTAVVAVAAVVATVASAGSAGFAVAGTAAAANATITNVGFTTVGVAMVGAAVSTLSISAINTSMNADGSILKQGTDITKTAVKDTTSRESLKNIAIAGLTAAITFGVAQGIDALANSGNAANAANGANTLSSSGEITNASQFPTALDSASTSLSYNPSAFNLGNSTSLASTG